MQTPDGQWRVEVVLDWLSITAVERILVEAGVDMATLAPVAAEPASETGAPEPDQLPRRARRGPAAGHGAA